ncbi:MAG: alpha/beta hydrolase family protein [Acidimicrobiales bacterium]
MTTIEPARSREIRFDSDGLNLAGTFALPEAAGVVPAVLLLPGSGQTDRDDNAKRLAINLFPPLTAAIGEHGFATLCYDKRGVGASDGDFWTSSFDDLLADAIAAVGWLRDQPEIDASHIFVLGHSEGALVAIRLAAGGAPVSGIVLLAGSAQIGEQTLTWQAHQIAATLSGFNKWLLRVLHIDVTRSQQRSLARIKAATADVVRIQGRRINARWMRQFLTYDPKGDLARINMPVLAITGDHDVQVDPDDLDRMRGLVPGRFDALRLVGSSHLFRPEGTRRGLAGYKEQARRPPDPQMIAAVIDWLERNAHGNAHPRR